MDGLRRIFLRAWLTLLVLTALSAPALATQSVPAPIPSAEEAESSLHLERAQRKRIQIGLRALGFDPGSPDGLFGPRTRRAIREWQASKGEPATGYLDASSAAVLLKAGETASPPQPKGVLAQQVMDLLSETLNAARSDTDYASRGLALWTIAKAQAKAADIPGALSTARSITNAEYRVRALSEIAVAQAKAGDNDGARRTISPALSIARSIPDDDFHRRFALSSIAGAQARVGDISGALSTAQSITDADRGMALLSVAQVQAEAGDIAEALSTARSLTDDYERGLALSSIAEAQVRVGDSDGAGRSISQALNAARSLTDELPRKLALSSVARAQAKAGDISGALSTARSITSALERVGALGSIAEAQATAGDSHGAGRSLSEALSTAQSITSESTRGFALSRFAEAQARTGYISEALTTVRGLTSEYRRNLALSSIAKAQSEVGDVSGALSTARSITDIHGRAYSLDAMVEALGTVWTTKESNSRATSKDRSQLAKAAVPCDAWNTGRFFRHAAAADVVRCLRAIDPNARDEKGRTPLHAVAMFSLQPATVAALARAGADLDARDGNGRTPLHLAGVFGKSPEVVAALVAAGADINALDEKGRTPLQFAESLSKSPAMVHALKDAAKDMPVGPIKDSDLERQPPEVSCEEWNTASFFKHASVTDVSRCLKSGSNPNARSETGETPLHLVGRYGVNPGVVTALVAADARMNARDETGATPLHAAAKASTAPAIVQAMLDAGADPTARDEPGSTPEQYARANPALRESDLNPRLVEVSCEDWNTALFFERADAPNVSRCLESGASVDARDQAGAMPLHRAALKSVDPAVLEVLLDAGADPAANDEQGRFPWDYAKANPAIKGTDVYWRLNDARFE